MGEDIDPQPSVTEQTENRSEMSESSPTHQAGD